MRGADASNDRDVCLRIGSDGQSQGRLSVVSVVA